MYVFYIERKEKRWKLCVGARCKDGVVTFHLSRLFFAFKIPRKLSPFFFFLSQFSFGCQKCWTVGAAALKEVAPLSAWKHSSNCTQTQQVSSFFLLSWWPDSIFMGKLTCLKIWHMSLFSFWSDRKDFIYTKESCIARMSSRFAELFSHSLAKFFICQWVSGYTSWSGDVSWSAGTSFLACKICNKFTVLSNEKVKKSQKKNILDERPFSGGAQIRFVSMWAQLFLNLDSTNNNHRRTISFFFYSKRLPFGTNSYDSIALLYKSLCSCSAHAQCAPSLQNCSALYTKCLCCLIFSREVCPLLDFIFSRLV